MALSRFKTPKPNLITVHSRDITAKPYKVRVTVTPSTAKPTSIKTGPKPVSIEICNISPRNSSPKVLITFHGEDVDAARERDSFFKQLKRMFPKALDLTHE